MFYELASDGIMEYRDHWPKRATEQNIEQVGTDSHPRRKFRRILESLDSTDSIYEQAAFLLRAFSGLQLFPDANHRTGLVFVGYVLDSNGYSLECRLEDVVALVADIRPERGPYSARRNAGRLTERDASFHRVLSFMEAFVRRTPWWQRVLPITIAGRIRRTARRLPLEGMHVPEDSVAERRRKRGGNNR